MRYDTLINNYALAKKYGGGFEAHYPKKKVYIVSMEKVCKKFLEALEADTSITNVYDMYEKVGDLCKSIKL